MQGRKESRLFLLSRASMPGNENRTGVRQTSFIFGRALLATCLARQGPAWERLLSLPWRTATEKPLDLPGLLALMTFFCLSADG